jgi:RNA-directed DNA polymerase
VPRRDDGDRQPREGFRKPRSQASEKSGAVTVPKKSTNSRVTPEESAEGKTAANGKLAERNALRTQGRQGAPTNLARVGHRTQHDKEVRFTNLMCHIKVPLLTQAYFALRKDAAPGIDGVTWKEYGEGLEARLRDLQDRVHRGSYHPQPVRRVHIPKGDGRTRPLGIPALEDKVLQQAVRMVLEPIYESMFMGFSYGFRPGRSQHKALDALAVAIERKVNWIFDADIRAFFDNVDHTWMQRFVEHRIGDRRLVRLLMKWLKAGVMEEGQLHDVEAGTPQGGVISPLLANIYLHYALDLWAHDWRKKHARGDVYLVRYADDVVMAFKDGWDARAMHAALAARLARFGLELHPDKTRILSFGRYAWDRSERLGERKPQTFDFLGFTHICTRDKRGWFRLLRQTSRKKRQAKLAELRAELRRRRHADLGETHRWLSSVLQGHYNYYGVPSNLRGMRTFRAHLQHAWYRQLCRRSQRAQLSVRDKQRIEARYPLPKPRITHPWPRERFRGP